MTVSPSDSTPDLTALLEHSGWVRQLARAIAATPDLADEVEQEAWRIALERPPKHAGNLRAWWTRVVHSTLHQRFRRETRHQNRVDRFAERAPQQEPAVPSDLAEQMEDTEWLARTVNELPPLLGETLHLRYYQDLSVAEIAQQLGIAQTAVKSRLRRGLEELRNRFQTRHGDHWHARCLAIAGPLPSAVTSASLVSVLLMSNVFRLAAMVTAIAFFTYIFVYDGAEFEPVTTLTQAEATGTSAKQNRTAADGDRTATDEQMLSIREAYEMIGDDLPELDARVRIILLDADGMPVPNQMLKFEATPNVSIGEESATTDSNGVVEIPCISNPWRLLVTTPNADGNSALHFREDISLAPSGLSEIQIRQPRFAELTVVLLDHQNQPLHGMPVTYQGKSHAFRGWKPRVSTTTDGQGQATVAGIFGDALLQVRTANNFCVVQHDDVHEDERSHRLVCRMPETRLVRVRVHDVDSQPIPADSVVASAYFPTDQHKPIDRDWKRVELGGLNLDGSIVIEAPADEEWPLLVRSERYGDFVVTIPPQVSEYNYSMDAGHALTGKVIDANGNAIAGAEVRAWALDFKLSNTWPYDSFYTTNADRRRAWTDENGRFRVERLPNTNQAFVAVAAEGKAYAAMNQVVVPNGDDLVIQLEPGLKISGRVVDSVGQPMEGELVMLGGQPIFGSTSPWQNAAAMFNRRWSRTDVDGKFEFDGLTSEDWDIVVDPRNSFLHPVSVTVPGGSSDLKLELKTLDLDLFNLDCMVLDEEGNSIKTDVRAALYFNRRLKNGVASSGKMLTTRSSIPQIVVRSLDVDQYVLQVKAPGYAPAFLKLPSLAGMHSEVVRLRKAAKIKVQLRRPEGNKLYESSIKTYAADGTLIPNSKRFVEHLLDGEANHGLRSGAYGFMELDVPLNGGWFEVYAQEGAPPLRIDFGPEIVEHDSYNPFEIELME